MEFDRIIHELKKTDWDRALKRFNKKYTKAHELRIKAIKRVQYARHKITYPFKREYFALKRMHEKSPDSVVRCLEKFILKRKNESENGKH